LILHFIMFTNPRTVIHSVDILPRFCSWIETNLIMVSLAYLLTNVDLIIDNYNNIYIFTRESQ